MELVRGVSLVKLVRVLAAQRRTLSAPLILHVARALLDALHYAHTLTGADGKPLGLIHRDVTPHNILVSINGEVKLTDFGIAKVQAAVGQTRPGVVRGKMDYLAPEQLRFERLDSRVDQFAAGLTLFFLATGRSPFARGTTQESLKALQHDPLPMLETLRPDLPRELVDAIKRATEKEPARRFASARAFRDALPPPSAEERPELLGALVREVFPQLVGTLDRASRTLAALNASTGSGGRAGTLNLSQPAGESQSQTTPATGSRVRTGTAARSSEEPRAATVTETVLPEGTVAAPVMAELESSQGDAAPYVPKSVEEKGDGTLPMEPPPFRSQRRWLMVAAVVLGVLVAAGLGVAWWMLRSEPGESPGPVNPGGQKLPAPPPPERESAPVKEAEEAKPAPPPPERESTPVVIKDPAPPPPAEPQQPAPPAPGSNPEQEPVRKPAAEPRGRGFLTVHAIPWGQVFIAGKEVGQTPMARFSVPTGNVDLELRNPETGKMVRRRVKVQAGKEHRVKVDLR
jgi:eukaryotic-like serine/threonine-protein kinase